MQNSSYGVTPTWVRSASLLLDKWKYGVARSGARAVVAALALRPVDCSGRCISSESPSDPKHSQPSSPVGRLNTRDAPTVLNSAQQFVEHRRRDRKSVPGQVTQALVGPLNFCDPHYASAMKRPG